MIDLLSLANNFFANEFLMLSVQIVFFIVKFYITIIIAIKTLQNKKARLTWLFLLGVLAGSTFESIAWIVSILSKTTSHQLGWVFPLFIIRISWTFLVIQYQSLALFIESLIEKKFSKFTIFQKVCSVISTVFVSYFLYITFFGVYYKNAAERLAYFSSYPLEFRMRHYTTLYLIPLLLIPILILVIRKIKRSFLPKLLKKQLSILTKFLIVPFIVAEFLQSWTYSPDNYYYGLATLSSILLTCAVLFCAKKIIGLRFLNIQTHVGAPAKFNFINDFKSFLEELGHVTTLQNVTALVQNFFNQAFKVPAARTKLFVRNTENELGKKQDKPVLTPLENTVEEFLNCHADPESPVASELLKSRILITDEIAFSDFYEESPVYKECIGFLNQINADIFLPIYEKNSIIAYIIIERDARIDEFYSNVERDEILVFASYLSNILNLLYNKNLEILLLKEKEARAELYSKHQEINQYKESISSFLRANGQRPVGIVLYKNRRFSLANQEAHDFIGINLNAQDGHVITKTFKSLARQVAEYRSTITMSCKNKEGKKIILYGTPQLDDNTVIILVSYPEIADIIKSKTELLHDPSAWDYLLYLETTHSGQLINHLIPGGGSQLLQFKLDLLKLALSKNALLLEMPEEDLQPMVEIIHNVSLRERLYTLNLTAPAKMPDIAIKLFGINHVFASTQQEPGLLEQVSKQGTLFIHNVHFLPREVQTRLAEFIKYGHYTIFRSDQKIVSGARLICSSNQNLALLTANGKFCTALFEELRATTLSMPSLLTLSDEELSALAQGLADQAMEDSALKNILELNEKETGKLVHARPVSLQEFKYKVQQALQSKAKKSAAARSHQFDTPVIDEYDPFLADAARMGKRALKDSTVMHKLWSRFRNQNKIAEFLGVNRSSVYRRCKDFGFHELE